MIKERIGWESYQQFVGNHEANYCKRDPEEAICEKCETDMEEVRGTPENPITLDGKRYETNYFMFCPDCGHTQHCEF